MTNESLQFQTAIDGVADSGSAAEPGLGGDGMKDIVFWEKPSGVSLAAEVVRRATIKVLSERIQLLGVDRSGAYEHYNIILSSGFPIPSYEIAILDLVKRHLPALRSYHEIGSGLGTLPFMLAHDGFASVGVERDERRNLTAVAILRDLSKDLPNIEGNCRLIGAAFPDAIHDLDVSESMAILTDFVSSQNPGDYVRLCRSLACYRYVLLDLQRFCLKRDAPEEQQALIQELVSYGLAPCPEVIDLGGSGYYRLFEGKHAGERPRVVAEVEQRSETETFSVGAANPTQLPATVKRTEVALRQPSEPAPREQPIVPAEITPAGLPPMPQRALRRPFGGWLGLSALLVIGIPTLLAVIYYGFLASSQYATTFQFAVRGPSQAATGRSSAAALMGPTAMSPDAFVVTDYINSTQALADVERSLDVRSMFSKPGVDFLSRLPAGLSEEELKGYWANMVWANFDLISGNVSVSVRAFTPQDSLEIARILVASSDGMFRKLNNQAQQDFVRVADQSAEQAREQLSKVRRALSAFRAKSGLVDPDRTAQAGSAIVDDLRKQLATLQAQYASVRAGAPDSPMLGGLSSQIAALEKQIKKEDVLGASAANSVSAETLSEFNALDVERQLAEKQYTEALSLRTQAYLVAQNQQSYLALFVAPKLAQTPIYPDRLKAIAAVVLGAAVAWFAGMLIVYALRDHLM